MAHRTGDPQHRDRSAVALAAKLPLGRLPGDILLERENFRFYLPLTSMLLVSALLSLILWLFKKW